MCGITGFSGAKNQELLEKMTNLIAYRGPDDKGYFSNGQVNFGHRRLSIIDLESGAQPMFDRDKEIALVFNGEIYNFQQLREKYLGNHSLQTKSDTEVIIYLYKEKGEAFLQYLNGMFALALWDNRTQKLILARDRMGQKPLYYRNYKNQIYFSSEPKSLLIQPAFSKAVNYQAVSAFFLFQYFPSDQSIYQDIFKLLPGHYLVWEKGRQQIKKYWDLQFENSIQPDFSNLEKLLDQSVRRHLVADVPLGIFLSGGIDSTTIAYYAAKNSSQPVKTFSVGFNEDKSFDESAQAETAAKFLKTQHHHQNFSEKNLIDLIPEVFEKLDEPLADASILPTYLLSKFTRQSVKVALGGDGADELLAGYPTFKAHAYANIYGAAPAFLQSVLSQLVVSLPVSHSNFSQDFKLKRFIKGASYQGIMRDVFWVAAFSPQEQVGLFKNDFQEFIIKDLSNKKVEVIFNIDPGLTGENKILAFWQKGYLVDDILTKVDRASMYNSLEVRCPFLDYNLVSEINNLAYKYKFSGNKSKVILKNIMSKHLPESIINRPKKGFGVPLARWFGNELKDFMIESLSRENVEACKIFNYSYVEKLINSHLNKKQDNRIELWSLISFVQWYKNWV